MTAEMANVVEFIRIRQRIELLAKQITSTTEKKAADDSSRRLEEASQLLAALKEMVSNDVQEIVIGRLTRQLAALKIKIQALTGKERSTKKQPAL